MEKWYEAVTETKGNNYISSRVRLARNWNEYPFPSKLDTQKAAELVGSLQYGLSDIDSVEGNMFITSTLDRMKETEKLALKERRILNKAMCATKDPVGLMMSEKEDVSIILNGDDHIRLQLLAPGLDIMNLWNRADKFDDYINSRFKYAFDEKYGYLTSFPTNVGTGMRANIVVHLPMLTLRKQYAGLVNSMARFGLNIKGVYGQGRDNFGDLYDISNVNTLGVSEKEILELVTKAAIQLNDEENAARQIGVKTYRNARTDEAYKSYGVLKYARKLTLKDGLVYLSHLMTGVTDELISFTTPCSIYSMMLGIQPANIMKNADHPLDKEEIDIKRAEYIRNKLPEIKEA